MARRRSGFQKKIDTVHWTNFSSPITGLGAGVAGVLALSAQHLPETLLRTRGELIAYVDGVQAPPQLAMVTCGLILVPEGTGTTVLWSPFTDGDAPWFYWDVLHIGYEEYVIDVVDAGNLNAARRVIDSKAMRKVRNTEIQFVVENTALTGAASVNVVASGRVLSGA